MSKKPKEDWNYTAGLVVFGLVAAVAVFYYAGMFHDIFKMNPEQSTLLIICGIAGAVSGLLFTLKSRWWMGILPGALAGAGGFQAFEWYVEWFDRHSVYKFEVILICMVGALPGLLLYFLLNKLIPAKAEVKQ